MRPQGWGGMQSPAPSMGPGVCRRTCGGGGAPHHPAHFVAALQQRAVRVWGVRVPWVREAPLWAGPEGVLQTGGARDTRRETGKKAGGESEFV